MLHCEPMYRVCSVDDADERSAIDILADSRFVCYIIYCERVEYFVRISPRRAPPLSSRDSFRGELREAVAKAAM